MGVPQKVQDDPPLVSKVSYVLLKRRVRVLGITPEVLEQCQTLAEVQTLAKQQYRRLDKQYHPDILGQTKKLPGISSGLHTPQIVEMYELRAAGWTCQEIATQMRLSQNRVWEILHTRGHPFLGHDVEVMRYCHARGQSYNAIGILVHGSRSQIRDLLLGEQGKYVGHGPGRPRKEAPAPKIPRAYRVGATFERLTATYDWLNAFPPHMRVPQPRPAQRGESVFVSLYEAVLPLAMQRHAPDLGYGWQYTY